MSSELLLSVKIPLLLEAMSSIVGCHAHFVSPATEKAATTNILDSQSPGKSNGGKKSAAGRGLLLVVGGGGEGGGDQDELPGSSITLSIVLGLLSAILGGGREVSIPVNKIITNIEVIFTKFCSTSCTIQGKMHVYSCVHTA